MSTLDSIAINSAPAAADIERAIADRFLGTGQHPCADCRDAARSGAREPQDVRAGTLRRDVGGLGVRVCAECAVCAEVGA